MLKTLFAVVVVVAAASAPARAAPLAVDIDLLTAAAKTAIDASSSSSSPELAMVPVLPLLDHQAAQAGGGDPGPPMLSGVGVGLQLGFPSAITVKFGAAQRNGFVVGLGFGFNYSSAFGGWLSLHGEYQIHLATLVRNGTLGLTFYFAPGLWLAAFGNGRYGFYDGYIYGPNYIPFGLAVRGTLGLSMTFTQAPVELYLELTPAIFVFPGLYPAGGPSLGLRWFF